MCNLYSMTEKGELERYIASLGRSYLLPDFHSSKPVGPFGTALILRRGNDGIEGRLSQWGLIKPNQPERIDWIQPEAAPGKKPPAKRARSTNNARIEAIDGLERKTNAVDVWKAGRRCLFPAAWYAEPNWETKKNVWWHLRRADGRPWFIAGLWSDGWVDPDTGEIVASSTMITVNCNDHPMLNRLHKPEFDPVTKEILPMEKQDKRSLVHIDAANWDTWLRGPADEARALLVPQPAEFFDQTDAMATDALLALQATAEPHPPVQRGLL